MRLRIKNWKTYQHYDHRCPPWIKLHFRMLSSRDWVCASDCKRVLAIACMLIASQDEAKDGSFEADPEYFQRVAYLSETPDFNALIESGFLEMLADASGCKQKIQNGGTEKETELEKETECRAINSPLEGAMAFCGVFGLTGISLRRDAEQAIEMRMGKAGLPAEEATSQIRDEYQTYLDSKPEFRKSARTWLSECNQVIPKSHTLQPVPESDSFAARNRRCPN